MFKRINLILTRSLAIGLSLSLVLTAPGTTAWAAGDTTKPKSSKSKKSSVGQILSAVPQALGALSTAGSQIVAVSKSKTNPSHYTPLAGYDFQAPQTAVQEAAIYASIAGSRITDVAEILSAGYIKDYAARMAGLIGVSARAHEGVSVGFSGGVVPSKSFVEITPFLNDPAIASQVLRNPTVQELLAANKMSWEQLESTLEQQRLDIQARDLKIRMAEQTNRAEDAAIAAEKAATSLPQNAGSPLSAADSIAAMNVAQRQLEIAEKAFAKSQDIARKTLEELEAQIAAAPASAQPALREMFEQVKAQVLKSLAQAAAQLERARAAFQRTKTAAQPGIAAVASHLPTSAGTESGGSFTNLTALFTDSTNLSQLGWGVLKSLGGGALLTASVGGAVLAQGIPLLGQIFAFGVASTGAVTGASVTLSGLTEIGLAFKNAWYGGPSQRQRIDYRNAANGLGAAYGAAAQQAADANNRFNQAQARLKGLGINTNLLDLASQASDKADEVFHAGVRAATNSNAMGRLQGDVNAAISDMSANISALRKGSQSIGTNLRGFDGLMKNLYSATSGSDKAYHNVLGHFLQSSSYDQKAAGFQRAFTSSLSSPAAKSAYNQFTTAYHEATQTANAANQVQSQYLSASQRAALNRPSAFAELLNPVDSHQSVTGALMGDMMGAMTAPYSIVEGSLGLMAGKITGNVGLQMSSAGEIANNPLDRSFRSLFGWAEGGEQVMQATFGNIPTTANGQIDYARLTSDGRGDLAFWLRNQQVVNQMGMSGLNAVNYSQQGKNYAYLAANAAGDQVLSDLGFMTAYKIAGAVPTIMGVGSAMSVASPFVSGGVTSTLGWMGASEATAATAGMFAAGAMGRAVAIPFVAEYAPMLRDSVIDLMTQNYSTFDATQRQRLFDVAGEVVAFPVAQKAVSGLSLAGSTKEAFRTSWNPEYSVARNVATNAVSMGAQLVTGSVTGAARFATELTAGAALTGIPGVSGTSAAFMVAGGQGALESGRGYLENRAQVSNAPLQSRQIENIVNRNGAQTLLTAVDAPKGSEVSRYVDHPQVMDAAARRLSVSENPADRALFNDLASGRPVDVGGRQMAPREAVVDAAQRTLFESNRSQLTPDQLNALYEGKKVTLADGRGIEGSRINQRDTAQQLSKSGAPLTESQRDLLEGRNQNTTSIPESARVEPIAIDSIERARQMAALSRQAEPAHDVLKFEGILKEGRTLQMDAAHPERFRNWLERSDVAMTEDGFNQLWDARFKGKSLPEAQAEMDARFNGSSADYVAHIQQRVTDILQKHQVDFSRVLTDRGAASRVDAARAEIMKEANPVDRAAMARVYAEQAFKGATGNTLRKAQSAMVSLFGEGRNAGVDAGGGKTEAFIIDQGVHAMLGRDLYRGEILAENAAASAKYESRDSVRKLSRAFGIEVVDGAKLQTEHKTNELIAAMRDPHSLVVMDPVTRGHLSNEAVKNSELRSALLETNVVGYDEIHQVATTRTSSIIGGGEKPPTEALVQRVRGLYTALRTRIYADGKTIDTNIVRTTNNLTDFRNTVEQMNRRGETGIVKFGSEHIVISDRLNAELSALGYEKGEISSVVRTLISGKGDRNSYDIGTNEQGRTVIFPVNDIGKIETSMISNDTVGQISVALKEMLNPMTAVRVQETQMQTGLAAIFENAHVRQVGASATIEGLNRLMKSRVGSEGIGVSTSRLDLAELLNANGTGLRQGGIPTIRIEGKEVAPDLSLESHRAELARQMREALSRGNVIIATENVELRDFFADTFKTEIVNSSGQRLVIDGQTSDAAVNQIAASKETGKVIIINPRAYTGTDFQMHADLWVMGAERLPEQELIQLLKRVNRPNPANKGVRWDATRNVVPSNVDALERSLNTVKELQGMVSRGQVQLADVLQSQKARDLYNRFTANETLSLAEKIELNAFVKQAQVNSEAAKFAIQDALRDRLIIQPLKDALKVAAKGSYQERVINEVLSRVLNSRGNYSPLTAQDFAADRASIDFMKDTLRHVTQEAKSVLSHVENQVSNRNPSNWTRDTSRLKSWVEAQRTAQKEFEAASSRFETLDARGDLSISRAKTAEELLGVIKETNRLVLTGETAVVSENVRMAASSTDKAWNTVRSAVRQVEVNASGGVRLPSVKSAQAVFAALKSVDLSAIGNDYRNSVLRELIVLQTPDDVRKALGELAVSAYGRMGRHPDVPVSRYQRAAQSVTSAPVSLLNSVQGLRDRMSIQPSVTPQLIRSLADTALNSTKDSAAAVARLQTFAASPESASMVASTLSPAQLDKLQPKQEVNSKANNQLHAVRATAIAAPQTSVAFDVTRPKSNTSKQPVVVTVKEANQSAIDRVSDLREVARAGTPVVVTLTPAAAQNADFVSKMKLQMRLANRQGGDFYLTQPDGSAVKIGAAGGRNVAANKISGSVSGDATQVPGFVTEAARTVRPGAAISETQAIQYFGASAIFGLTATSLLSMPVLPVIATVAAIGGMLYYASRPASFAPVALTPVTGASFFDQARAFLRQPQVQRVAVLVPAMILVAGIASAEASPLAALGGAVVKAAGALMTPAGWVAGGAAVVALVGGVLWYNQRKSEGQTVFPKHLEEFRVTA